MKKSFLQQKLLHYVVFITFLYAILFFLLKDTLLLTPDFVGSDAFHVNLSLKYQLWKSIHMRQIPFWTPLLQGGYPLFAEGQMGALFLPNYFAAFISNQIQFPILLLVLSLYFLTLGLFLLLAYFNIPYFLSFLVACNFTWSGAIIFRWVHLNELQVYSLFPSVLLVWAMFLNTQRKIVGITLIILLTQMLLAGHLQTVFNCYLGLLFFTYIIPCNCKKITAFIMLFLFILTSFFCAAPQLLSSYLLYSHSVRIADASYAFATSIPFHLKNIQGYFSTNYMGTPLQGTYPLNWQVFGVYWENMPFVGIIYCLLIIYFVIDSFYFKKGKEHYFFFLVAFFFILLALGANSPLYFLFDLFPFNLFRVTGRFLLIAHIFLMIGSAFLFNIKKQIKWGGQLLFILLIANLVQLITTAFTYNLLTKQTKVIPHLFAFSQYLDKNMSYLVDGFDSVWFEQLKKGWNNNKHKDQFLQLSRFLYPNSNLLTNRPIYDVNTGGLRLRRPDLILRYMSLFVNNEENETSLRNLAGVYGINTIISTKRSLFNFQRLNTVNIAGIPPFTIFRIPGVIESTFYVPTRLTKIHYMTDLQTIILEGRLTKDHGVVEEHKTINQKNEAVIIKWIDSSPLKIETKVKISTKSAFLVLKRNWYPEWHVFIDGKKTKLFKTNITHIGFEVPEGSHTIVAKYIPCYFYYGLGISVVVLSIVFFSLKRFKSWFFFF